MYDQTTIIRHDVQVLIYLQDILFIKQNVSLLNGPVARMTALISVIFAELTIIGGCSL